jgi:hypothetical protein
MINFMWHIQELGLERICVFAPDEKIKNVVYQTALQ